MWVETLSRKSRGLGEGENSSRTEILYNRTKLIPGILYPILLLLRREKRKKQKSRSEEKMVGFSSPSLFTARKWEPVTQDGTRGIDYLMQRTQGASITKGWEDKQNCQYLQDTFT